MLRMWLTIWQSNINRARQAAITQEITEIVGGAILNS